MLACSAMQHAAAVGFEECIPLLLENGADIDGQNQNGVTALSMAAQADQPGAVKLLLESGADITVKDHK